MWLFLNIVASIVTEDDGPPWIDTSPLITLVASVLSEKVQFLINTAAVLIMDKTPLGLRVKVLLMICMLVLSALNVVRFISLKRRIFQN